MPENIEYVRVTYPDGTTTRDLIHIEHISATEGRYLFFDVYDYDKFNSIPQGDYTFVVKDFDGNKSAPLSDTIAVVSPLPNRANCTPLQDSTVLGTTPAIDWGDVSDANSYRVRIYAEADDRIHASGFLTDSTYTVPEGILEVGKTYSYRISAYEQDGSAEEIDNASSHWLYAAERHHFTVCNTETGSSVTVEPVDETTETTPVTVTYYSVDEEGATELTTSEEGSTPPEGFMLGDPPTYYEITTTAEVSGTITVCVDYSGVSYGNEEELRFYHYEDGDWVDVTKEPVDTENDIICGEVNSLSPFAIVEPFRSEFIDIKPATQPNSINLRSRGVTPVAVLTTQWFDAMDVDPATVKFAGAAPKRYNQEDVDGDGDLDLIFHFATQELDLNSNSTSAALAGKTYDGTTRFCGKDTVEIVP